MRSAGVYFVTPVRQSLLEIVFLCYFLIKESSRGLGTESPNIKPGTEDTKPFYIPSVNSIGVYGKR
jgi:hypothetical protein